MAPTNIPKKPPNKLISLQEAVSWIDDGHNLTFSGFAHSLAPIAVVREVIRQQKRDLELSSMGECWAADFLCGAGLLKRARLSNYMFEGYGRCMNFSRAVQTGALEVEDYSHFGISSRFAAAALGTSYLPTKVMAGTDLVDIKTFDADKFHEQTCPFTGESYLAVRAIQPDIAFIHAHRADAEGNVQVFGMSSIIEEQAKASKKVVVSVEEIVPRSEIARHPAATLLPGFMVDAVVEVPFGAHPAGMFQYYNYDDAHIRHYWDCSRDESKFQGYLDEFVYATKTHWSYLEKIGLSQLFVLRADPYLGY